LEDTVVDSIVIVALAIAGLAVGLLVFGVFFHRRQLALAFENAQSDSKRILEEARREADHLIKSAVRETKEESRRHRQSFEDEARQRRAEVQKLEQKLKQREEALDKKISLLDKREKDMANQETRLLAEEQRYQRLNAEHEKSIERTAKMLEQIASMSPEDAKRELMRTMEAEARKEAQEVIRRIEEETKIEAENRARSALSLAVQRISGEFVSDSTVSVVALPSEDMKGRIIGREGRNIRALEQATGVDLIIDDTPEAVIISCFNPVRREIAKTTLERLIGDGRIHPARIEETAKRVETEFDQILQETGDQACFETGITDLHPELVKLLGRLKYRTAGQKSVLAHAIETAHLCGILAGEMGLNVKKAKRAGLLHDVGKAVGQEVEGHHSQIGADFCARYNESADIVDAIRLHHSEDLSFASPLAIILHTANLLSASRTGARKEQLESYVKRLENMENVVRSMRGVEETYVIQAGREVRVIVNPAALGDQEASDLASEIASRLRQEITFPGQVKITVLRESKGVDYAK
jgi:ribonuclease Y